MDYTELAFICKESHKYTCCYCLASCSDILCLFISCYL